MHRHTEYKSIAHNNKNRTTTVRQESKNSHTKTTGNRQTEQTHRQKQQQRRQLLHEINNRSQYGLTALFSKPLWRFKWSAWKVRKLVILAARGLARSPAPTSCPLPAPLLIQVAPSKRSAACGSGTGRRSSSSFARLSTARRSGTGCRVHIFRPTSLTTPPDQRTTASAL